MELIKTILVVGAGSFLGGAGRYLVSLALKGIKGFPWATLAVNLALFTLLHMSELLEAFNPVQLLIMPMMFVLALLMAIDSVKVCKEN